MEIVTDAGITYLVAMSQENAGTKVNFINIDTSEPFNIVVTDRLSNMRLLEGEEGEKLVLYAQSGNSGVHFLSLLDIDKERGRNLERFPIQGGCR